MQANHTKGLQRLPTFALAGILVSLSAFPTSYSTYAAAAEPTPKDPPAPTEEKPKGPDHNVTLAEEQGVVDLLKKAQKAREKAQTDPSVWPECVKYYAEILKKYPNSVYLDKWEGPEIVLIKEPDNHPFKNGLYKSTRERVAQDIASLPRGGLEIYRAVNDPPAKQLFQEAQDRVDERKMEQVAVEYASTSVGVPAMTWLAEVSYDSGARRQSIARVDRVLKDEASKPLSSGLLIRKVLAFIQLGEVVGAQNALKDLKTAAQDPANGPIRAGHLEGEAALKNLSDRVAALTGGGANVAANPNDAANRSWDTYFGNSAHNRVLPARSSVGVSRWSVSLNQLLYGPNADAPGNDAQQNPNNGQPFTEIPTLNNQLIAHEGYFYLCDSQMVVAYPAGLPVPGVPSVGGNAKFVFPADQEVSGGSGVRRRQRQQQQQQGMGIYQHPYFVTIANERLYMVCGGDPTAMDPNMWRGMEQKQPSNYLVSLGRQRTGGTVESGKLVWTLKPDSPTFLSHSKADQDWLKSVYFTSAPTYENGVLYTGAVHIGGTNEAWVAAFDAESGRMLWHTMICAATPIFVAGVVQPDVGLPVTVANGTVYICTNLGAVAALDALGGTIRWIRVYDRVKLQQGRWQGDQSNLPSDFWGPNPPIVYKNLLIVTPQDSDMLYAYYTEDGKTEKGTAYEMGQRKYHVERVKKTDTAEVGGLKHVLGIVNGNLCITGSRVHFFDAWSGKISGAGESISTDSPIFGRGVVTENMALVPTERSLVRIDATLIKEKTANGEKDKFTAKVHDEFKWNPKHEKEEAGNIFIAGDVLYTVSHTHVNAFFVWEEMERKLKDRITAEPADLGSYVELAGVYFRIEHFEDALSTLEKGEAEAEKLKSDPKAAANLSQMRTQRFETLKSLGQKAEGEKAYGYFKRAYETAKLPEVGKELPVIALNLMAENANTRGDAATAVQHYQEIVAKYGDVVYAFVPGASSRARLFAQARIEDIRRKSPDAYAKFEAEAAAALGKAGSDAAALENVVATYPNATASLQALLKLAQVSLASDPDRARQNARRYLNRVGNTPESVQGLALLEAGLERSRMFAAAKDLLYRISERTDAAGVKLEYDPLNPETKLAAPISAKEWATTRLNDKLFKVSPSSAIYALGKEQERLKDAWSRQAAALSMPVVMHGMIPQDMRRNLFYIENQTELSVISGRDGGDDLWQPRPKLPANCRPMVYWADRMMVLFGDTEIVALDSKDKGKVVWRYTLRAALQSPPQISPDAQKVVIAYPTGTLSVLDATSGSELWFAQLEGALAMPPALGDGCVAIAVGNPIKVVLYDLDTQAKRGVIDATAGLSAGPVIYGDRMYLADHGNKIRSFDTHTGKLIWEAQCDSEVRGFYPTRSLLFAITPATAEKKVRAYKTEGEGDHASWWIDLSGAVTDIHADADDLYVVVAEPGRSGGRLTKLKSFSIPKGGKFQWETDAATEFAGQLSIPENLITTRHLVLTQSNWDPTGAKASAVVLVERRTGKLIWDQALASDPTLNVDGSHGSYAVQLFDGGLTVCEARKRTAYVASEGETTGNDAKALDNKYLKNPEDPDLALRWARTQYDSGEREKALGALVKVLGSGTNLTDDKFSQVYDVFSKMRRDNAIKAKTTLKFSKLDKAPKLDGNLDDWKNVAEQKFDSWRDVYLTSEQVPGAASRKASWKGVDDVSVSFRGGYDDKNLYVLLLVKDDKHKNDQAEGQLIDLGDSALLMFDSKNDGGVAFRGEQFSLGGGLTKAGAPVGWRWLEHGKFLTGRTPIENGVFAKRNEAEKSTVYQFALPLESLALKAEPGKQFGFSFAVLDQDQEDGTPEKAVGSSPGVLSPPEPRLFSKGEFSK